MDNTLCTIIQSVQLINDATRGGKEGHRDMLVWIIHCRPGAIPPSMIPTPIPIPAHLFDSDSDSDSSHLGYDSDSDSDSNTIFMNDSDSDSDSIPTPIQF